MAEDSIRQALEEAFQTSYQVESSSSFYFKRVDWGKSPREVRSWIREKSGVFLNDKLKGKKTAGGYRSFPIDNIDTLIKSLVKELIVWSRKRERIAEHKRMLEAFSTAAESLGREVNYWSRIARVNPEKYVRKLIDSLEGLQKRISARLSEPHKLSVDEGNLADNLAELLMKHTPLAPKQTIATRVSDLLKSVDVHMKVETIRKRIIRRQ